MINKKALFSFIGLTFGATILLACAARRLGLTLYDAPLLNSQMVIAAAGVINAGLFLCLALATLYRMQPAGRKIPAEK